MLTKTSTLNYRNFVLDADQRGGQNYLRVGQLVQPFGVTSENTIHKVIQRNPKRFREGDVTKLPVQTAGGVQEVTVITWAAALKISGLLTTQKARDFNAWFMDVMLGNRRSGRRPDGSLLRGMQNPFEIMEHPMFEAGLAHWRRAAAIEEAAKQEAKAARMQAERVSGNIGVTRRQARKLIEADAEFLQPAAPQGELLLLEG